MCFVQTLIAARKLRGNRYQCLCDNLNFHVLNSTYHRDYYHNYDREDHFVIMEMRNGATGSSIFLLYGTHLRDSGTGVFAPESFLASFIDLRIYYLNAHSSLYMYNLLNNRKVIKADIDCH